MNSIPVRFSLLFVLLVLVQVCLLNQIHFLGFVTPFLYIYFLLKLPLEMNRSVVILLSFLLGFVIDILTYTWGIHMLAMTVAGFLRHYIIPFFTPRDIFEDFVPGFSTFGRNQFMGYAMLVILIHHTLVYVTEFFSLLDPLSLLLKISGSFLITSLLVFAFEGIALSFRKK